MSTLIKICGVTTPDDVRLVGEAGADAIGFNFWSGSKRFVGSDPSEVIKQVPSGVLKFGVFVNASEADVLQAMNRHGLDFVQLHGDERPEAFTKIPRDRLVRALRIRNAQSFAAAREWSPAWFLFDAFVDGYGGGGIVAPWGEIAAYASAPPVDAMPAGDGDISARRPFLLAGGLTPENVAQAIVATGADGVDVASGVERAPGRKDPARVRDFVAAVRSVVASAGFSR